MSWIDNNFKYISGVVGVLAGIAIISSPEKVPNFVIILIGIYWLSEGAILLLEEHDKD